MTHSPVYNFAAGPATLPKSVLLKAQQELLDYQGSGTSIMEVSHRGRLFEDVYDTAEQNLRNLMGIPEHYKILFPQGGAHTQFNMIPLNFAHGFDSIDSIVTGHWSRHATAEMRYLIDAKVHIAANAEQADGQFLYAPKVNEWQLSHQPAFVHFVSNETVHGVQYQTLPKLDNDIALVCDMSSDILSRAVQVEDFGVIYAGAQKNIGPAGATIVIIREDLLARTPDTIPQIWRYQSFINKHGMYNTLATYPIYIAGLVLQWLKEQGGVAAIEKINTQKANLLYQTIDQSGGFYRNNIQADARSRMNVVFFTPNKELDALFVTEAEQVGLKALKGHAAFGGLRASMYNAMPLAGAQALARMMVDFQKRYG